MRICVKNWPFAVLTAFLFFSCRKDTDLKNEVAVVDTQSSSSTLNSPSQGKWKTLSQQIKAADAAIFKTDEYYAGLIDKTGKATDPAKCNPTPFNAVVDRYFSKFGPFEIGFYSEYATVNRLFTFIDESKQYFGANGEYTHEVIKQQRRLESFWAMPDQVHINGQHNATLNDRDKIARVYMVFSHAARDVAYEVADQLIAINNESEIFVETPLISFDGFATPSKLITLGDGLIEALNESGIDKNIVIAGLISHEWGHQVQFINSTQWFGYAAGKWPQTAEFTRNTELEADFFSSYFLTHKRGGAYNWKKVAGFNNLFFDIGDCAFSEAEHHGTPKQRLAASKLGYTVASQTWPKGHILTATQLHKIFKEKLSTLL